MTDRDLLDELHSDVKLLLSYVVGTNGTPGLVKRVSTLEEAKSRIQGALALIALLGPIAAVVVSRLIP